MKDHERILKAFANRRRLAIVAFLKKKKEVTVGEIAEHIQLSFTSTSKHLNILSRADILDKYQRGLEVYYFLSTHLPSVAHSILVHL